jgi:hypothetical protein
MYQKCVGEAQQSVFYKALPGILVLKVLKPLYKILKYLVTWKFRYKTYSSIPLWRCSNGLQLSTSKSAQCSFSSRNEEKSFYLFNRTLDDAFAWSPRFMKSALTEIQLNTTRCLNNEHMRNLIITK